MPDFGPQIADQVRAAAVSGAAEAAAALGRTLGGEYALTPGEPATFDSAQLLPGFAGPGLIFAVDAGPAGAAMILPESDQLYPSWCAEPDITGKSKLATLAQELGMLLLPEAYMPSDFRAARVPHLADALSRAGVATGAGMVPVQVKLGESSGTLFVVWPAQNWKLLTENPAPLQAPASAGDAKPTPSVAQATQHSAQKKRPRTLEDGIPLLPPYGRSLLRIMVPVSVSLATAKQPVGRVVELGPGSILQFDKSCNDHIQLNVGSQVVAEGEAVKVGEKFGIRITSMVMPAERFLSISSRTRSG